jgi:hypothetical protein
MNSIIADIFEKNKDVESFRKEVIKLEGSFSFTAEDMQKIGNTYLEIYPDSISNRNAEQVQIGYKIVRICVLEKIIRDFPFEMKNLYRAVFLNPADASNVVLKMVIAVGHAGVSGYYDTFSSRLNEMKTVIDLIPKGMVKERYIGGITNLYNVLYIIKINIDKNKT